MKRLLIMTVGFLAVIVPGLGLSHYYFTRVVANPTSTTSTPVLGAPTTTTQWACVRADGTVNGALQSTQAAAEPPCGALVATDGITRYLEERVTTTRQQTTTTSTRRVEVLGGSTLKVSDAHAALLLIAGGGGGGGSGGGGGESIFSCDDTHTAASTSQANVQSAINAALSHASEFECVQIPAGSSGWTSGVSANSTGINLWIKGAGDLDTVGGGDVTVITDNIASTSQGVFELSSNSGYLRLSGVTITNGTGLQKESGGIVELGGSTNQVRFDHNTIDGGTGTGSQKWLYVTGYVEGVIDHNILDAQNELDWIHVVNGTDGSAGDNGDTRWDDDTGFGTSDFLFIEDNIATGDLASDPVNSRPNHAINDCHSGGKHVTRFNSLVNTGAGQTHPTGHASNDRGCRAHEIYGNVVTGTFNPATQAPLFVFEYNNSGPALIWGNDMGTQIHSNLFYYNNCRSADGLFCGYSDPFGGWETCGESSQWDGNTGAGGYPCLDQPGRGKGDLLNGDFPSKINVALGDDLWPRQLLEPVYEWSNTGTRHTGFGGAEIANQASTTIVQNRDFYHDWNNSSCEPGAGSCTAGVGVGTLAQRPANCTTGASGGGVGWWATDQGGDWNTSNGTANDGALYKCTATNTWTLYYTPYTYPHPLTIGALFDLRTLPEAANDGMYEQRLAA